MFGEIRKIWEKDDLLKQAFDKANSMFDSNEKIFIAASEALIKGSKTKTDIYKEDRKINKYDMEIRKKILEHLSINPRQDVVSSLILIGVSRDIERLGDFSKNILELSLMYRKKFPDDKYFRELMEMRDMVLENFKHTREAFRNSDRELASKVMEIHHKTIKIRLDHMLEDIMNEKRIDSKKAVTCSLFSRYLKRISAHLMNIASTVVNPFHKVRYQQYNGHVKIAGKR